MKKTLRISTIAMLLAILFTGCQKEQFLIKEQAKTLFIEDNLKMNLDKKLFNQDFLDDLDIVAEGLSSVKSENVETAQSEYIGFIETKGFSINKENAKYNEELHLSYSQGFIDFINEFDEFVTALNSYEKYVAFMVSSQEKLSHLSTDESDMANEILLFTDILYQVELNKLDNESNARRWYELTDYQYQCLGKMGLGLLTGCGLGSGPGCIMGLALGALTC